MATLCGSCNEATVRPGKLRCNPCLAEHRKTKRAEYARTSRVKLAVNKPTYQRDRLRQYRAEQPHVPFYVTSRYHAKKAGCFSDLTKEDALELYELPDECAYCGKLRDDPEAKRAYHMDHIIPLSQGGVNSRWNLVKVCSRCNSSKNDRSLLDFYGRTAEFTEERYSAVIDGMVRISKRGTDDIYTLLKQSHAFEVAYEAERQRMVSIMATFIA